MSEAEQVIMSHLSEQFKKAQNQALGRLQSKLTQAILQLQSDDVLESMRNDASLEQFKIGRIRQLLQEVMADEKQVAAQSRVIAELKNNMFLLQVDRNKHIEMGKRKQQDYMDSLADIEQKYIKYRQEVEQQVVGDRRTSDELRRQCQLKDRKIEHLQDKLSASQSLVQTMQSDMSTIRNKWETRCSEIESQWKAKNRSDMEQLKKHYQAKLQSMVAEYNKCTRQGTPMVVQADEELLMGLKKELKEMRARCAQAELQVEEQSREVDILQRENSQYKESIHEQRERENRITSESRSAYDKYQEQVRSNEQKTEECRRALKQLAGCRKEIEQLKGEVQRQERLRKELEQEQLKQLQDIRDRVERESEDSIQRQSSELYSVKEQLRQRSSQVEQLESEIDTLRKVESRLKSELNARDSTIIEQQTKLATDKLKFRAMKEHQRKLTRSIEQMRLPIERLKNENILLREQVKYELEVYKRRLQTELMGIIDKVVSIKERAEKDSSNKMMTLLAQVEETSQRDAAQLDRAQAQNEILHARLEQYERAFEEKLIQIKEDVRSKEGSTAKIAEQLQRAKDTIERLEGEKQQQLREWERELRQFKKDLLRTVHTRRQSANQPIYELIAEEIRAREKEVERAKFESRQKQDLIDELEKKLQQGRNRQQDLKQRLSELQVLKDRCHMEEQSRRKLEKQLKEIRLQLLTKDGTISELTKLRREKENISRNHKDEKERELEQIRAMIVKTYEVVGGRPTHDVPERAKRTGK